MPHWVCDDCGGHFKMHQQEHVCNTGICEDEKKVKLEQFSKELKSKMLTMLEHGIEYEWLDEYKVFVLEKWVEELESWL